MKFAGPPTRASKSAVGLAARTLLERLAFPNGLPDSIANRQRHVAMELPGPRDPRQAVSGHHFCGWAGIRNENLQRLQQAENGSAIVIRSRGNPSERKTSPVITHRL
jgi:hypothetical protein